MFKDVAVSFRLKWVIEFHSKLAFLYFLKETAVFGGCTREGGGVAG